MLLQKPLAWRCSSHVAVGASFRIYSGVIRQYGMQQHVLCSFVWWAGRLKHPGV
jgi:hypothetical protein